MIQEQVFDFTWKYFGESSENSAILEANHVCKADIARGEFIHFTSLLV